MSGLCNNASVQLVYLVEGIQDVIKVFDVAERLKGLKDEHPWLADGGHIGMVQGLQTYADEVAVEIVKRSGGGSYSFPGVFEYEVTSPLGKWLGENHDKSRAEFTAELKRRTDEFFKDFP